MSNLPILTASDDNAHLKGQRANRRERKKPPPPHKNLISGLY